MKRDNDGIAFVHALKTEQPNIFWLRDLLWLLIERWVFPFYVGFSLWHSLMESDYEEAPTIFWIFFCSHYSMDGGINE